jgi:alpha-D-ribose 1-methylphosphonate 5-triphosphate diphosphatase
MIIRNARIVLHDEVIHGSLNTQDGLISSIHSGPSAVPGALDFEGDYLVPGLVELHTDNLEKHLMPRPKVRWPTLPAILAHDVQIAGAGITTVLDALSVGDIDHESVRLETLTEAADLIAFAAREKLLRADHLLHLRCEIAVPGVVEMFSPFVTDPRIRLVSLMDHTPGQRQWTDLGHYRTYVTGKKGWSEEKVDHMLTTLLDAQQAFAEQHRRAIVQLCQQHHIPLATHDDTIPAHVQQALAEGVAISEFPTTLEAARLARAGGMATIMGSPNMVRGGSHSGNVASADIARAGLLDALSSDYVPASLLHSAFLLTAQAGFSLPQAVATVASTPARIVGLHDRGELRAGLRADFLRVKTTDLLGNYYPVVRAVWRGAERIA